MRKFMGIVRYTFVEIFRNKVYYVLLLFGGVLVLSTMLFGSLGGEQRNRMITDLGLAGIEVVALVIAVFAAVTLVIDEMETRTLYLILTRPVARYQFLLGRYVGLLALVSCAMAAMAATHALLLALIKAPLTMDYVVSLLFSWEKITIITAVALAFSLFSTSTLSAVAFTLFFWIMGHLSPEIRFLAQKSKQPFVIWICRAFYYLAPNFHRLNLRDWPAQFTPTHWLALSAVYGIFYACACLALAVLLFRKKEF